MEETARSICTFFLSQNRWQQGETFISQDICSEGAVILAPSRAAWLWQQVLRGSWCARAGGWGQRVRGVVQVCKEGGGGLNPAWEDCRTISAWIRYLS